MNSKVSTLSRCSGFWVGTALSFAALFSWSVPPTLAQGIRSQGNIIAERIATLQQSEERWIEVDLSQQKLIAWEGSKKVYRLNVSTGKSATPTITGTFTVQSKHVSGRMRGPDYNVPYVPYIMYFSGGYAIHGAYWHNRFGTPVSHGCVNLRVSEAEKVFRWASVGTPVIVHR
ncbi:L,D-transpeptidase [Phormidium sp. LEGE 05292]|uniref:L,D-transpeptidase n=1 Tax=[Phormidium] sp. LEGE 05292 TaxID=767427 RepID=UPI00187E4776|nr:L,D-transpeptidase [Phormidium sp. LEGE 05292]MBE9225793.1 L,D-transpeptidase [Phormidium sp. LEGE 05292]